MAEVEKKGIGKAKIGLVASGVLVAILLISSIWLGIRVIDIQRQVSTLQTEKSNLQSQLNTCTTEKTNLQSQISDLQTELTTHKNLYYYKDIVSDYTVNQGVGSRTLITSFNCDYAGYLEISLTSTTTNAYIEVEYFYGAYDFHFKETYGTSGWGYFCVLPTTIYIYVGNTNLLSGATHTISITYYY